MLNQYVDSMLNQSCVPNRVVAYSLCICSNTKYFQDMFGRQEQVDYTYI